MLTPASPAGGDQATLVGLSGFYLDGDGDSSVQGNATAWAAESLTGLNALRISLDGAGTINAIVSDTSFVDAHSVGGMATATSQTVALAV